MRVGEHTKEKREPETTEPVMALMITHERPGLVTRTVESFHQTAPSVPLMVFDDGSADFRKRHELEALEWTGVPVTRFQHRGLAPTWLKILNIARTMEGFGSFILLEDDLVFAPGWLNVLLEMARSVYGLGLLPGAMSCLRTHREPQGPVVRLGSVEAYQSMAHGFQVNLLPAVALERFDVIRESVEAAAGSRHGLDIHLIGNLSHRMGRTNFVTTRSWVAHIGADASVVVGQGLRSFDSRGYNLVEELAGTV